MKLNKYLLILFLLLLISPAINSQQKDFIKYVTQPGSRLWIEGSSTISSFNCKARLLKGFAYIHSSDILSEKLTKGFKRDVDKDEVDVTVLVYSLDCGLEAMNEDMYHAMKAAQFPTLRYDLIDAHLSSKADSAGWFELETKGELTIAGETNVVDIIVKVLHMQNGSYRLIGSKSLMMKDYGIEPPSHLWGLVKAHNRLKVFFDLIVAADKSAQQSTQGNN
ncbi:MAG TPA: YceI family protein [Ignavibacteriaceae bacterium]|nr:YceI family protein [Ignavibacteriaceae bacterium]